MIKVTLWHSPEGFHFWILGGQEVPIIAAHQFEDLSQEKFLCLDGGVAVGVASEFSEVPIHVEFDRFGPDPAEQSSWDRIVECSLEVTSGAIEFGSAVGDAFGRLEVPLGSYRLRIFYGGQCTMQADASTEDFYLIQIWPSRQRGARILKPEVRLSTSEGGVPPALVLHSRAAATDVGFDAGECLTLAAGASLGHPAI